MTITMVIISIVVVLVLDIVVDTGKWMFEWKHVIDVGQSPTDFLQRQQNGERTASTLALRMSEQRTTMQLDETTRH